MRNLTILFLAVATLMVAANAWAGDNEKSDHKMDGAKLFKTECRPCHLADSDNGEYTPMSLISDQWDEFFDEYYLEAHADVPARNDETKKVTDVFDKDMLKLIRKFCVDHAADSEQPMTCG